jgi:hypothetical protein
VLTVTGLDRGGPETLWPYGRDRRIAYDLIRLVDGTARCRTFAELLDHDEVDLVQASNVAAGCHSFTSGAADGPTERAVLALNGCRSLSPVPRLAPN